jgi:hypothetical protein
LLKKKTFLGFFYKKCKQAGQMDETMPPLRGWVGVNDPVSIIISSLRDFLHVGIYSIDNCLNQDFQDVRMNRIKW